MNIGIFGAGNVASGLGGIWAKQGHVVYFGSHHPEKAVKLAQSIGVNAQGGTVEEAAKFGEIIVIATPWASTEDVIKRAVPLEGRIIIDCTNPVKQDMSDLAIGHTTSAAEEIAKYAPEATVVKAFNTVFAEVYQSRSRLFGSRMPTMFFCGDSDESKAIVRKLIIEAGFEPIDAGPLTVARYLEPLAMLMIKLGYDLNMGTNIAMSLIRR